MAATVKKSEVVNAVNVLHKRMKRPISMLEISNYVADSTVVPDNIWKSIRAQLANMSREDNKQQAPIINVIVDGESCWLPRSAQLPERHPESVETKQITVAPALSKRKGISLTIHRVCPIYQVIKLEFRKPNGWEERQTWQNMHMHICSELVLISLDQTKESGVLEVRYTYLEDGKQLNESISVSPKDWVILTPAEDEAE